MTPFKDYFSGQAAGYAEFRPRYPAELFAWLASIAPARERAWDCATGSGQAALGLAGEFGAVIATDASAQQIEHAVRHPRVTYRQAAGEDSGIPAHSIDLVAVAQALHWLRRAEFFAEALRVLRPRGVLALWGYDIVRTVPEVDAILDRFGGVTLADYWAPERAIVVDHYRSVHLPFEEIPAPPFTMTHEWTRHHLIGYLRTWSAVRVFTAREGSDPVTPIEREIAPLWPDANEPRPARWELFLRVGRAAGAAAAAAAATTGSRRR